MNTPHWRAAQPGDRYAINLWLDERELPWSVCRVAYRHEECFEAWRRAGNGRGGYWGGEIIGVFQGECAAEQAKSCCVDAWRAEVFHSETPEAVATG